MLKKKVNNIFPSVMVLGTCLVFSACQIQSLNSTLPTANQEASLETISLSQQVEAHFSEASVSGDAEKGEKIFNQFCTACHLYSGDAQIDQSFPIRQTVDTAPALDEMGAADLQKQLSQAYLQATIHQGKSTPAKAHSMPSWQQVLDQQQIDHLVAFIIKVQSETDKSQLP